MDLIKKKVLKEGGFVGYEKSSSDESKQLHAYAQKVIEYGLTKELYDEIRSKFEIKLVCNTFFNGDMEGLEEFDLYCKSTEEEKKAVLEGRHPLFVTLEEMKMYHTYDENHDLVQHEEVIQNRRFPLGTPAGHPDKANSGYLYDLYKKGLLYSLLPEVLIKNVFDETGKVIPKPLAVKWSSLINKQKKDFEANMLKKNDQSDMVNYGINKLNQFSIKNSIPLEQSSNIAEVYKNKIKKIEKITSTELVKGVIYEDQIDASIANVTEAMTEVFGRPLIEMISLLKRRHTNKVRRENRKNLK